MSYFTKIQITPESQFGFSGELISHLDTRLIATCTEPVVTSVDLSRVIATTHPDYAGSTWGDLKPRPVGPRAETMKRQSLNLSLLEQNPDYYLSRDEKEHWSFYRLGDQYIIETGNHRTIYARFFLAANGLAPRVHGVSVCDITLIRKQRNDNQTRERHPRQGWMSWLFRRP